MTRIQAEKLLKEMGWELFRGNWYEPCNPKTRRLIFKPKDIGTRKKEIVDFILLQSKFNNVWYTMNEYDDNFINPKYLRLLNEKDFKLFIDVRFKSTKKPFNERAKINKDDIKQCGLDCPFLHNAGCYNEKRERAAEPIVFCNYNLRGRFKVIIKESHILKHELKNVMLVTETKNGVKSRYFTGDIEKAYRCEECLKDYEISEVK